jgi:leucyl-tRNA synthetase
MKLLNLLDGHPLDTTNANSNPLHASVLHEAMSILIRVLYPVAPHITYALWHELGYAAQSGELADTAWCEADEAALVQDEITYTLQVNGKLRGQITVPAATDRAALEQLALAHEAFIRIANGAAPKKIIVVPNKLVNVVI